MSKELSHTLSDARSDIRCAMIDAAGATRIRGGLVSCFTIPVLENLSPLVGGWLPDGCERKDGKIVVNPR